jgi:hypothetical protein
VGELLEAMRSKTPDSVKQSVRPARERAWLATSRARVLPDFLIIGGQRCGTTSFYHYLTQHHGAVRAKGKEIHFFDFQWKRGIGWYRSRFPLRATMALASRRYGVRAVTGEATPYYLFHPWAPRRAFETVPDAKLIVLIRDPVARAHSHYEWMVKHGFETLPFRDALEQEDERLRPEIERIEGDPEYSSPIHRNFGYLLRGLYAEQLGRWLEVFPADQLFVIRSEDFFEEPREAFRQTFEFLAVPAELRSSYPRRGAQSYSSALEPEDREFLIDYFRAPNARLYELIGRDLSWPR